MKSVAKEITVDEKFSENLTEGYFKDIRINLKFCNLNFRYQKLFFNLGMK